MLLEDRIKLLFDGVEYEVSNSTNLVEAMDEKGVHILAPCLRNGRKKGCCKACIVEVDGKRNYACGLKPKDGMNIVYDRQDLKVDRKVAAKKYANQPETSNSCCGSTDVENNSNGCGCNSDNEGESSCC